LHDFFADIKQNLQSRDFFVFSAKLGQLVDALVLTHRGVDVEADGVSIAPKVLGFICHRAHREGSARFQPPRVTYSYDEKKNLLLNVYESSSAE
jgi:hypothetical protein